MTEEDKKDIRTIFNEGLNEIMMPVLNDILDKLSEHDRRFDSHDQRFDAQDQHFDDLGDEIGQVRSIVEREVTRHDYFSEKISDLEKRIRTLEPLR
jgi:hypothetical protein